MKLSRTSASKIVAVIITALAPGPACDHHRTILDDQALSDGPGVDMPAPDVALLDVALPDIAVPDAALPDVTPPPSSWILQAGCKDFMSKMWVIDMVGDGLGNSFVLGQNEKSACIGKTTHKDPGTYGAKDSFVVGAAGEVRPGPLFIMEKMAPGFSYLTGDWRYTETGPDGTVAGTTKGVGAARVEYCIACHLARERQDHLYFVPEAVRAAP